MKPRVDEVGGGLHYRVIDDYSEDFSVEMVGRKVFE